MRGSKRNGLVVYGSVTLGDVAIPRWQAPESSQEAALFLEIQTDEFDRLFTVH